jgi:hypothetical protein
MSTASTHLAAPQTGPIGDFVSKNHLDHERGSLATGALFISAFLLLCSWWISESWLMTNQSKIWQSFDDQKNSSLLCNISLLDLIDEGPTALNHQNIKMLSPSERPLACLPNRSDYAPNNGFNLPPPESREAHAAVCALADYLSIQIPQLEGAQSCS